MNERSLETNKRSLETNKRFGATNKRFEVTKEVHAVKASRGANLQVGKSS
jgi:hypothetical protein